MPLYRIERSVGDASEVEIGATLLRSVACIAHFDGLAWRRSYFDAAARTMTCYFDAAQPEDLERHATMAHIPCGQIVEVVEYQPGA